MGFFSPVYVPSNERARYEQNRAKTICLNCNSYKFMIFKKKILITTTTTTIIILMMIFSSKSNKECSYWKMDRSNQLDHAKRNLFVLVAYAYTVSICLYCIWKPLACLLVNAMHC